MQTNCAVGDLSSKLMSLAKMEEVKSMKFSDTNLPLSGTFSVVGRSIVLRDTSGARWVCANIMKLEGNQGTCSDEMMMDKSLTVGTPCGECLSGCTEATQAECSKACAAPGVTVEVTPSPIMTETQAPTVLLTPAPEAPPTSMPTSMPSTIPVSNAPSAAPTTRPTNKLSLVFTKRDSVEFNSTDLSEVKNVLTTALSKLEPSIDSSIQVDMTMQKGLIKSSRRRQQQQSRQDQRRQSPSATEQYTTTTAIVPASVTDEVLKKFVTEHAFKEFEGSRLDLIIASFKDSSIDRRNGSATWVAQAWSSCSATCGGGTQSRELTCTNNVTKTVCTTGEMSQQTNLAKTQSCGIDDCPSDFPIWAIILIAVCVVLLILCGLLGLSKMRKKSGDSAAVPTNQNQPDQNSNVDALFNAATRDLALPIDANPAQGDEGFSVDSRLKIDPLTPLVSQNRAVPRAVGVPSGARASLISPESYQLASDSAALPESSAYQTTEFDSGYSQPINEGASSPLLPKPNHNIYDAVTPSDSVADGIKD
jgi:hypothetical protein